MTNPYGWSQPTDGQPAVYFVPPGENIRISDSADNSAPADNGFGAYQSFMDQYQFVPQHDPFARSASTFNPFQNLSARGARAKVSIIDATILWLKNWRNFSGRASQSEYWGVQIVQVVIRVLWVLLIIGLMQMTELSPTDDMVNIALLGVLLLTCAGALLSIISTLSLTVRRLHDTDHSGWYYLMQFLPFGSLLVFYRLAQRSDPAGYRFDDSTQPLYGVDDLD